MKNDGTVLSCGLNSGGNNDGQLGDGTTTDRTTPVQVVNSWGNGKIIRVEASREHSLFLKIDGALWAAGRNNYGQMGYGSFTSANSSTPVLSAKVCKNITIPTNVPEFTLDKFQIFPNPASSQFTLSFSANNFEVKIFSVLGTEIYSTPASGDIIIDLSDYPKGVYMVRVIDNDRNYSRKVLMW